MGLPGNGSAPLAASLTKERAMKRENRQMLRLALAVREQFVDRFDPSVTLPVAEWEYLHAKVQRTQRASMRGLRLAATKLRGESIFCLERLRDQITTLLAAEADSQISRSVPSAMEIYRDLMALHEEFDEVSCSLAGGTLSVTTDRIVLEGIGLGRFTIELQWDQLPGDCAYRVIAEDPNPAVSNGAVTHPHVEDEALCAGDGRSAIHLALSEGRLADFFLIVANILRTYNVDSAYVTLDAWEGKPCVDCGSHVAGDDYCLCSRCDSVVCEDCGATCPGCSYVNCSECSSSCAACDASHCTNCLRACPACKELVCPNCLLEKDCECCHEEKPENESPESDAANHVCSTTAAV